MIGQSVGSDASRLSCFLFRPRKRLGKCRKRSHTNVSNASVTRTSTPPAQTPQRSFQGAAAGTHATPAPNRAHSGSQGETGGVSAKSAESLRDSDVLMRVAVPQASRPRWAALSLPVIVHRRALGVCHRCDKGQRTLLAGLLSFCLRCRGFFFGYSGAFF